jgi:hypothetical protein
MQILLPTFHQTKRRTERVTVSLDLRSANTRSRIATTSVQVVIKDELLSHADFFGYVQLP